MASTASPDDFDRLMGNVREELQAQNAMDGLGLSEDALDRLAEAIAVNVQYVFDVRWAPRLKEGEPHAWEEGGAAFAECVPCRIVFGPAASPAGARDLYDEHRASEH